MHYILDCDEPLTPNGEALMEIHNTFRVGNIRRWKSGIRHEQVVPVPIEIVFDSFRGYIGPPVELCDVGIPIMSQQLANTLTLAGVANIDFYDAVLTESKTGAKYHYKAFNIIGLIAAADLGKSEWSSPDADPLFNVSFKSLTLKDAAIPKLSLFRLAENVNAIVVSSEVRDFVLASGLKTLKFTIPQDWVQL